jgi:hypothetical protein
VTEEYGMPIIVPIEDNKVGLATATDAKFRAPESSGSGLEALGAGLVQLGAGLEERRRRAAEAIAAAMLDDRHRPISNRFACGSAGMKRRPLLI